MIDPINHAPPNNSSSLGSSPWLEILYPKCDPKNVTTTYKIVPAAQSPKRVKKSLIDSLLSNIIGTSSGTRTHTAIQPTDFKSGASANSAMEAKT